MKVFYFLGCIAVLACWWKAAKGEVKENGKFDVTIGDILNLVCLTICSWLGVAKVLLASNKEDLYDKVIYTWKKEGDDETVHSDTD